MAAVQGPRGEEEETTVEEDKSRHGRGGDDDNNKVDLSCWPLLRLDQIRQLSTQRLEDCLTDLSNTLG